MVATMGRTTSLDGSARRIALLFALNTVALSAWGGQWQAEPSLFVGATYSDNLRLSQSSIEDGDFVTQVRPQILLQRAGPRWTADLNYRLQGLFYSESGNNNVNHFLNATSTAALVPDRLFLNVIGNITQQIIDPADDISFSTINNSGNRTEAMTLRVNPYWVTDLGQFTKLRINYQYGANEYEASQVPDSDENLFGLLISSQPAGAKYIWSLSYQNSGVDYDTGQEIDLERGSAEFGYQISPRAYFVLSVGADDNSFSQLAGLPKIDGSFWMAGVRGELGQLTNYEVRVGEQFFGTSYFVDFNRRTRKFETSVSYTEEATSVSAQQLAYQNLLSYLSEVSGFDLPQTNPDLYVRKRLNVTATYSLAKSSWRLTAYNENRDYLTSPMTGRDDGVTGFGAEWTWQLDGKTSVAIGGTWQQFDLRADTNTPEDIRVQVNASRDILDGGFVELRLWHNERAADRASDEYEENAISLGVGIKF